MNRLLERLGGGAVRWRYVVIIGWVIILGGLVWAKSVYGGDYVNNYTVSGTDSARGLDTLNAPFPQQGGYGGQIVFKARHGTVTADQSAINQATTNVSKLPACDRRDEPVRVGELGSGLQGRHDRVRERNLERQPVRARE